MLGQVRREAGGRFDIRVHTRVTQIGAAPLTPAEIGARVDRARRRLGQDRLDLVQLQWWNLALPGWIAAGEALAALARAGALAHVGVTNFPAAAMVALLDAGVKLVSNQVQMSLLDTRAGRALAPIARARGVKILAYGPLAGGFLGPAWRGRPAPPAAPTATVKFPPVYRALVDRLGGWAWLQALLDALAEIGTRHAVAIPVVALAWLKQAGDAAAILVGLGSTRRAPDILAAEALVLTEADLALLDAVLARRGPIAEDVAAFERDRLLSAIAAEYSAGAAAP